MPKQTKTCRVCGKTYEACRSIKTGDAVFNWREVACSPECGKIYLHRIMVSRSKVSPSCSSEKADGTAEHRVGQKRKHTNVVPASETNVEQVQETATQDTQGHEE